MIAVAAGVIVREGRVLLCRRAAGRDHAGKWEFPGGKIEPGETPREALARELREELAIDAEIGRELWRTEHRYPRREPVELHFLEVAAFRGAIDESHFAEVRWVAIGRLAEIDVLEGDVEFVRALAAGSIHLGRKDSSETGGR